MTTSPIVPCLWFDDQAEEAASFYAKTFPDGRIDAVTRYPSCETPSGKPPGSVLTVEFRIADMRFTALNGGPRFVKNPSISFFVHVDTAEEANRLHAALVEGGIELMPLGTYPWSERYAWVQDRFGTSWQVFTGREPGGPVIVPFLMFSGKVGGCAKEAMELFTKVFEGGRIERVTEHPREAAPEGWISESRFRILGQQMAAFDSPVEHAFGFNEGISLQVMCKDQQEVDRYWDALSEGGQPGPCGWLTDRFGISWQIVPEQIADWIACEDEAARTRAFAAVMEMSKLEIAEIERAFRGG